jgi:hypothetical protein
MKEDRRTFIKKTALGTTGITLGASTMAFSAKSYNSIKGANERINVSVIGVRGQGNGHLRRWAGMAKEDNVFVKTICDVDENLFEERVKNVTEIQGEAPGTQVDMRKVFDDKEIDVVSIATPNHWHALAAIWAVQAGKDVYVEKPCSHNVWEGRQMIEAARKYNKIMQVGFQNRSIPNVRKAMQALHNGVIGDVYMAKGLCYKPRGSFGSSEIAHLLRACIMICGWARPNGDRTMKNVVITTGTGTGIQAMAIPETRALISLTLPAGEWVKTNIRLRLNLQAVIINIPIAARKRQIHSHQFLNMRMAKMLQFETRGLDTNAEGKLEVKIGNIFYGTEGWMELNGSTWQVYLGKNGAPGPGSAGDVGNDEVVGYLAAPGGGGHYNNFIAAVRSGNKADLTCDIYEGFLSTALPHLANISYRLGGPSLDFDPVDEKFINNQGANDMLTREYREPFVVPDKV